jgi:UDP-glucose 4-epimerase
MKVLITGGAGFIGSNIADSYIQAGHEVVVVDNLSSGHLHNIHSKAKLYLMDIRSQELDKVFEIEKPDIVNHHAAQKSVPKSVEDPMMDADINILGFLNILNLCVKYAVHKVIYVSSGGALAGDAAEMPTTESYPPIMVSPYAITKLTGEKYLHFYNVTHGLQYTVLRYSNVYGPRQVPEGECGVVPIFMENAVHNKPSALFAYPDMPRGTTRDYVYVDDVCHANVQALTMGHNEIINIGSGNELYIEDIYNCILKVLGKDLPLIRERERTGDVRRSVLDISKAKNLLGWAPKVDLEEGIERTYKHKMSG